MARVLRRDRWPGLGAFRTLALSQIVRECRFINVALDFVFVKRQ